MTDLLDYLKDKILIDDGCWEWDGKKDSGGYGRVHLNGKKSQAHRVVYELLVGPIPDGLLLDHLCRNRICVRPDHLDPVTAWDNIWRSKDPAYSATKRLCKRGHRLNRKTTIIRGTQGEYRFCRACRQAARRPNLLSVMCPHTGQRES